MKRHKTITDIKTRIRNKRQLVIIGLESNEFVFLTPQNVKQNTGLEVYELELLVGSKVRIEFYEIGEIMLNLKRCEKKDLIVKEYFFELCKPVEKLRVEDKHLLLPFKAISQIFYFYKFNRENVGIKMSDESVIFLPLKRFTIQSNLEKGEQHILVDSYVNPQYYSIGDKLPDGSSIQKHNVLRWLNIRYAGNIESMHEEFENSISYYDDGVSGDSASSWGYDSWEDMSLHTAYESDASNFWNTD
jgi:hypothetical protein